MKNILCISANTNDATNFQILKQYFTEYNYSMAQTMDESINFIDSFTYEIVVIDFSTPLGESVLKYLMQKNSQQRTITMSENLHCSVLQGCDYCFSHYNRRRVLQPVKLKELIYTMKNFDEIECDFKNQFSNIINILDKIILNYNCFTYDSTQQVIVPKENSFNKNIIPELIEITKLLTEKDICFSVDKNFNINIIENEAL